MHRWIGGGRDPLRGRYEVSDGGEDATRSILFRMPEDRPYASKERQRLTQLGRVFADVSIGGATGYATGGEVGAALGAGAPVVRHALGWAANEFRDRVLSPREAERVADVLELGARKFEANVADGHGIAADWFLAGDESSRVVGREVIEGILLTAQAEHESKKLPYVGNLLGNLPFDLYLDEITANLSIAYSERLSYLQFLLLSLVDQKNEYDLPQERLEDRAPDWRAGSVAAQLADLGYGRLALLNPARRTTEHGVPFVSAEPSFLTLSLMECSFVDTWN